MSPRLAWLAALVLAALAAPAAAQVRDPQKVADDLDDLEIREWDQYKLKDAPTVHEGTFRRKHEDGVSLWLSNTGELHFTPASGKGMAHRHKPEKIEETKYKQTADMVERKKFRKRYANPSSADRGPLVDFGRECVKKAAAAAKPEVRQGFLKLAVEAMEAAVKVAPTWAPAYAELGDLHRRLYRFDPELTTYRLARKRGVASEEVLVREGDALERLGLVEEAEATFRQALAASRTHGPALLGLGRVLLAQGRAAEGRDRFLEAAKSGGSAAQAQQGLGRALLRLADAATTPDGTPKNVIAARQAFERGRDAAPDDATLRGIDGGPLKPELTHDVAVALVLEGRADDAITVFCDVLGIAAPPTGTKAPAAPGGDEVEAPDDAAQRLAPEFDPFRARAFTNLGLALCACPAPRVNEAAECFAEAAALDPTSAAPWVALGGLEERGKRFGDAAKAFRRALEVDPTDAAARLALGQLLFRAGQLEEAQKELEEALRLDPDAADAMVLLGHVALAQQRDAFAARYFARALDHLPGRDDLHAAHGVALVRHGELDAARAAFGRAKGHATAKEGLAYIDYVQARGKREREEPAVNRLRGLTSEYAKGCLELIQDTRAKQQWVDDFERGSGEKVANRWLEKEAHGVRVTLADGKVKLVEKVTRNPELPAAECLREASGNTFVAIEMTFLVRASSQADVRLVAMTRAGDDQPPTGAVFVGKNRRGELVFGCWSQGEKNWVETATGRAWPATPTGDAVPVRVGLERLAEKGRIRDQWKITVDGEVVAPEFEPGFRTTRDLLVGLSTSGDFEVPVEVLADDARVVERRAP